MSSRPTATIRRLVITASSSSFRVHLAVRMSKIRSRTRVETRASLDTRTIARPPPKSFERINSPNFLMTWLALVLTRRASSYIQILTSKVLPSLGGGIRTISSAMDVDRWIVAN